MQTAACGLPVLVHINEQGGQWYLALMPGGQWTERVLRVDSLADGAKLARDWIEERLRITGPSDDRSGVAVVRPGGLPHIGHRSM